MPSISGLSSGLDTATIISQLMQLEAAPQTRLKSRVSTEQSAITTLQSLNTKVALLTSKATTLAKPASWDVVKTSSSNDAITVTGSANAGKVSLTATVTRIARTHQLGFAQATALTDSVTGASTKVTLDRFDGSPVEIDTGDGTLKGLVAAINAPANATGLRASTVKAADGSYRLLVESATTGRGEDFDLTALDGSPLLGGATVRRRQRRRPRPRGRRHRDLPTNTFADVLAGVSLTVAEGTATGTTSRVSVARDSAKVVVVGQGPRRLHQRAARDIDAQTTYDGRRPRRAARSRATRWRATCAPRCSTRSTPRTTPLAGSASR